MSIKDWDLKRSSIVKLFDLKYLVKYDFSIMVFNQEFLEVLSCTSDDINFISRVGV